MLYALCVVKTMEEKKFEGKSKVIITIDNIHCADCALNIERSVEHLPGVLSAEVSYVLSSATVYYDPYRVEEDRIKKAITKPGYVVKESLVAENTRLLERKETFHLHGLLRGHSRALLDSGVDRVEDPPICRRSFRFSPWSSEVIPF